MRSEHVNKHHNVNHDDQFDNYYEFDNFDCNHYIDELNDNYNV
jgi:hypothetical protein